MNAMVPMRLIDLIPDLTGVTSLRGAPCSIDSGRPFIS